MAAPVARKYGEVIHVGVFVYDRVSLTDAYDTGRYVPLCNREKKHKEGWTIVAHPLDDRPLCSFCTTILEEARTWLPETPRSDRP